MQAASLRLLWSRGGVKHSTTMARCFASAPASFSIERVMLLTQNATCYLKEMPKYAQLLHVAVVNILMQSRGVASHRRCFSMALLRKVVKSGSTAGAPLFVIPHSACHGDSTYKSSVLAMAPTVFPVGSLTCHRSRAYTSTN